MNRFLWRDKCGSISFSSFCAKGADILQCHRRIRLIDGIQGSLVANILLGDEGYAVSCRQIIDDDNDDIDNDDNNDEVM